MGKLAALQKFGRATSVPKIYLGGPYETIGISEGIRISDLCSLRPFVLFQPRLLAFSMS